jgi:hypothetical protein
MVIFLGEKNNTQGNMSFPWRWLEIAKETPIFIPWQFT